MLLLPGRFMDLRHIRRLLFSRPDDIVSQIHNDFSMVLNLLRSQTPQDIQEIFRRSFATYYQQPVGRPVQTAEELWLDFCRHLDFLKAEGFVDGADCLTEDGVWASKLRLDHPLMIAEGLKRRAFPSHEAPLFTAVVAPFVYDGEQEFSIRTRDLSPNLRAAFRRMVEATKPLASRMKAAGFESPVLYPWTAAVMLDWAYGAEWDKLVRDYDIADGDLAMLISRTADNLRQITSLRDSHPQMATLAAQAREAILREPMFF
jgi:superfamily II RNA helicase